MWNLGIFPRMCVSAVVFYSWRCESRCMAKDIADRFIWDDRGEFIHIYETTQPPLGHGRNEFFAMAWWPIFSVVASIMIIICFCCICWKFYTNYYKRRESSNAALVPPPSTVVTFQARSNHVDVGIRNPQRQTGRIYGSGIVNFTFTSDSEESPPQALVEDVPPSYTTVVSQMSPNISQKYAQSPHNSPTKSVETPPPSYNTVAPFK